MIQNQWTPAATGTAFDLPPILKPLAGIHDQINILSGLSHLQADTFGDGTGDHPRSSAVWLTGVHAYDRTQPGVEVRLTTTADQIAARVIGKNRSSHRSSSPWTFPRRVPAIPATASTSTRSPGETRRHPIPPSRILASCSSGCSAMAAVPQRMARIAVRAAFWIRVRDEASARERLGGGDNETG